MRYKLAFDSYFAGSINLVDRRGDFLVCIYWPESLGQGLKDWPEGFWFNPYWHLNEKNKQAKANKDYHEHREEYIQEAKKLLVKEML